MMCSSVVQLIIKWQQIRWCAAEVCAVIKSEKTWISCLSNKLLPFEKEHSYLACDPSVLR